ncbi:hypothetical protein [Tenacibaculum finnmarkense]|uniref:hypothetical protein n=1 Tax=Tenacibaculum finnmarkense TaxID=2781243 RepID=UPI000C3AFF69|nr:hypothetical protein [Tenacibaculum finnmarkense]MCD8438671.1 hypothetical protein [Tenacibaculum finnmarkense genomovar ulcerans]MCG8719603.1 hypothetical protein [Tenacibaculum finnmarkense]SOS53542.1 conserved hypothetical protein [Tenacibaculum finnmarkense]
MDEKIKQFKNDCLNLDANIVVQKYLLDGSCYFFDAEENRDEFVFKKAIADSLKVHIRDIAIVGSGKLGFSIKPDDNNKGLFLYKKFDNETSDIDIAIVSNRLFDSQLIKMYEYTSQYTNHEHWNETTDRKSFAFYMLKGWLKPNFIPNGYQISTEIEKVTSRYKMKYGRDINIGIYKSWYFFEAYHMSNISKINLNLIANG